MFYVNETYDAETFGTAATTLPAHNPNRVGGMPQNLRAFNIWL